MEPLSGGNVNQVFRDGGTVVRSAGPWTPTVHTVLRHVRAKGFTLAPEPFGVADSNERLQYIEGDTATDEPWPAWVWADELLVEVVRAARSLHEAAADVTFDSAPQWRMPQLTPPGDHGTICHNDLAPYNVVTRHGHLVGIIDWDLIAPGAPLWEVAFMAWQWIPLHHPGLATRLGWHEPDRLGSRLRLLCNAYGLEPDERAQLIDTIIKRIESSRTGIADLAAKGDPAFIRLIEEGHTTHMAKTRDFIIAKRSELERAVIDRL